MVETLVLYAIKAVKSTVNDSKNSYILMSHYILIPLLFKFLKWSDILYAARFLKCVWPFYDIAKKRVIDVSKVYICIYIYIYIYIYMYISDVCCTGFHIYYFTSYLF